MVLMCNENVFDVCVFVWCVIKCLMSGCVCDACDAWSDRVNGLSV